MLTISNSGTADLQINSIQTNWLNSGDFETVSSLSSPIHPGGSTNLDVVFSPVSNGIILGQIVLYGNIPNGECYMAYLIGDAFRSGPPPAITITSPRNLAQFYAPAFVPITATIAAGVTNIVSVDFTATTTNGIIPIGVIPVGTSNSCNILWPNVPNGNYSITAMATDADGRTTTSPSISVTVVPIVLTNLPPVVTNASFTVQANSANNILNPLADDYDPNGDPLTIVQITPPTFGTASIVNNSSRISYTPKPGYYSESVAGVIQPFDELSYLVSDGKGGFTWGKTTTYVYPDVPPIVVITNPPPLYSTDAGVPMLVTASITNIPPPNIAKVDFYLDNNFIGEVTNGSNGSYLLNWTNVFIGGGQENITAIVTDILGEQGASQPVQFHVSSPPGALTGSLDYIVGSLGAKSLQSSVVNGITILPTIRDGVFQLYGKATNTVANVTWSLGVYSSDGTTLLRNLTPSLTGNIGTASGSGLILSNCDLTTLINGVYDLRFTVIGGGQEASVDQQFILESNLKIGQFSFSQQDLVIPVKGIPLTVTRIYNSQDPHEGDFGYGWTYSLSDMDVQLDETRQTMTDKRGNTYSIRIGGYRDVTLTLPNGQRTTFYYNPRYSPDTIEYYAQWQAGPGITAKLLPGPNSAQVEDAFPELFDQQPYWEDFANHSDVPESTYDFPSFILQMADGTKYLIERQNLGAHPTSEGTDSGGSGEGYINQAWGTPYLAQIIERNTNTITFATNAITFSSPFGATNHIFIQRNSQGLISSISDPNSIASGGPPAVKYEYDNNGNLMYVERLANGSTMSYVTNSFFYANPNFPHYITSIHNGDGTQLAENFYDDSGKLIKTLDANGNTTYFNNNFTNNTDVVVDPLGRTNTYAYDSFGNVIAQTNALGQITTMAYDPNNNKTNTVTYLLNGQPYATNSAVYRTDFNLMTSSTDPLGHTNGYTYNNNNGDLLSSSDARGNTTYNTYDSGGDLLSTTDALNNISVNTYNYGFLIGSTDPIGTTSTNHYDVSGNLTNSATLDASGLILSSNTYTYDANGNRLTSTVWRRVSGTWVAATTTNIYDAQNRVIETISPDGGINTIVYNLNGQQEETVDPLGHTNSYVYDAMGRLVQTAFPDGTTETSAYDTAGNRTNSMDQLGRVTIYQYDALDRLTNTIYPDNTTGNTVYDDLGRVSRTIDARGTITANAYDVAGRGIAVTNAFSIPGITSVNFYTYDPDGNQITFTDANGHETTNVYDVLNRQMLVEYPDGTTNATFYDADGRSIVQINQEGLATHFNYDGAGRLVAVTNALEQVTPYQYAEAGNQIAQIDALNRVNAFVYDGMGRRISHKMPGLQSEGFAYDLGGNVKYQTNYNGVVITNQYDLMNRLITVISTNGYNISYAYSATGQRMNMIDPSGATAYAYDLRDRLLSKTNNWNNGPVISLHYAYDPNGNVTNIYSIYLSTSNGVNLQYVYDPLNRLTNVLANGNAAAAYAYDFAGNLQAMRYGNGVTNQYQYDSLNRLTNMTWNLNSGGLAKFSYQLGTIGNRTNLNETVGGTNLVYSWQYDHLYRLTNENVSALGNLSYAYDAVGNRINRTAGLGLLSQSLNYNTNDWLTTDTYDNNGNTIISSGTNFQYDVMNHVTNVVIGGNHILISYDGDGNRVSKTASGRTTYYLVDDINPSGFAQVLEEWTNNGTATNLSTVYNYGLNLISQRKINISTNYFIYDGHGSTRMLTDIGGSVVNVMVYDAYGNPIASNGVIQTVYLYSGQQYDSDLDLYYNRARYLNTSTGRFWTMDTYQGNNEDPLSLHKYLYAADDPVNMVDPLGHDGDLISLQISTSIGASLDAIGAQTIARAFAMAVFQTITATVAISDVIQQERKTKNYVYRYDPSPVRLFFPEGTYVTDNPDLPWSRALNITFFTDVNYLYVYQLAVPPADLAPLPPVMGIRQWTLENPCYGSRHRKNTAKRARRLKCLFQITQIQLVGQQLLIKPVFGNGWGAL